MLEQLSPSDMGLEFDFNEQEGLIKRLAILEYKRCRFEEGETHGIRKLKEKNILF